MNHQFPKALFFDFDGVLADSVSIKTDAFRDLFRKYGDEVVREIIEYHRLHGGISRVEKIRYAFEEIMKVPLSAEEHTRLSQHYSKMVLDKVVCADWIPGAQGFLEKYYTALQIFVISGTPEDELKLVLNRRNMDHYFSEVLGSPVKKPVHVRNLLAKYNLVPQQCVFIGDALTDYDAAIETGLHFVGIQGSVQFTRGTVVLQDCTELAEALSLPPVSLPS
ncbi:HAD family hydrolase [Desulfopila sp. IMCC35008]|uniref:HAD family hydrolase n=1 Tax=Desulfopila sp. IMCC35008 TaxID=2653858 RepID=UPI0013D1558D|nr:HAD hydrolase-like protein [Desulfopila sp. IMCC35008]